MLTQKGIQELTDYMDLIQSQYDDLTIKKNMSYDEKMLSHMACLTEEVGELAAEVRKYTKCSFSPKKVNAFKKEHLEDEVYDCLFNLLYLAREAGVNDLDKIISRKIQKNKDRGYGIDK